MWKIIFKITQMKIFLHKTIKQPLIWAFGLVIILIYGTYKIFGENKDYVLVVATIISSSVVMFGYFATHYLAMSRELKEKRLIQCLELIKKIRFFTLEEHIKGTKEQVKLRDELQDAYFAFSLLTSEKSYKALSQMMEAFKTHLNCSGEYKCNFEKEQSKFVNELRNEFFIDKEIIFKTYDFRLSQEGKSEKK
ncbi:MAG: hypothetical protein WA063_02375 [Minisyncoccia bacterium]